MMKMRHSLLPFLTNLLLLLLAVVCTFSQEVTDTCPICTFEVEREPTDCKVYGMSAGGEQVGLTPWHHAIRPCLQGLQIPNLTMSQEELYDFCPNATLNNETQFVDEVNFDTFVNLVRDDPYRQEAIEIMDLFKDRLYFVKQGNGTYALNETLMNSQGVLHNCTETPSFCWNDIKTDMRGRQRRLFKVCTRWHEDQKKVLKADQRMARIRICNRLNSNNASLTAFPKHCDALVEQIKAEKAAFPDADCDAFGKGPGNLELPYCADDGGAGARAAGSGAGSIIAYGGSFLVTALVASASALMLWWT